VCQQIEVWNAYTFTDLQNEQQLILDMSEAVQKYSGEGKKLGKDLKKYDA